MPVQAKKAWADSAQESLLHPSTQQKIRTLSADPLFDGHEELAKRLAADRGESQGDYPFGKDSRRLTSMNDFRGSNLLLSEMRGRPRMPSVIRRLPR